MASIAPRIPLRRVDDLIKRLEAVKADTDAKEFGSVFYFIEAALIEARIQKRRLAKEKAASETEPGDFWRPEF